MVLTAQDFSKIFPQKKEKMEHCQPKHEPYVDAEPIKIDIAPEELDTLCQAEVVYPIWKRCAWILSGILTVGLAFLLYKRGSDTLVDAFADGFFSCPTKVARTTKPRTAKAWQKIKTNQKNNLGYMTH